MLRRTTQLLSIASVFMLIATTSQAGGYNYDSQEFRIEPSTKAAHDAEDGYSRTGKETYVYGAYLFTNRFLDNKSQTLTGPSGATETYNVRGVTPKTFHGIDIGIGKAVDRHVDLQFAYVQQFIKKATGTINSMASENTIAMQGLDFNVLYLFNPDDEIQVGAKIGVRVADFHEKVTLNGANYYPVEDTTEINPKFGMDLIWQFTNSFALRLGAAYTISAYRVIYDGDIGGFMGLSYTL